jgi:hypothetical protein
MVCIWLHIGAYSGRSPRLTLKAGCRAGHNGGWKLCKRSRREPKSEEQTPVK